MRTRISGRCTYWNDERGFGFLTAPGHPRVFCHATALPNTESLPVGTAVTFVIEDRLKGPRALQVQVVDVEETPVSASAHDPTIGTLGGHA
jgi:CspA family cold shock protein